MQAIVVSFNPSTQEAGRPLCAPGQPDLLVPYKEKNINMGKCSKIIHHFKIPRYTV